MIIRVLSPSGQETTALCDDADGQQNAFMAKISVRVGVYCANKIKKKTPFGIFFFIAFRFYFIRYALSREAMRITKAAQFRISSA